MTTIVGNPQAVSVIATVVLAIATTIGAIVATVGVIVAIATLLKRNKYTRSEVYQRLELASIDLFKFEIKHSKETWRLYNDELDIADKKKVSKQDKREILNHVTQLLNLFELCVELHSRKIFEHKIFATWLAWIFETAEFKNFRYMWGEEDEKDEEKKEEDLRNHYTGDLRKFINLAIEIIENEKIDKKDKFNKFKELLCQIKGYKRVAKYL